MNTWTICTPRRVTEQLNFQFISGSSTQYCDLRKMRKCVHSGDTACRKFKSQPNHQVKTCLYYSGKRKFWVRKISNHAKFLNLLTWHVVKQRCVSDRYNDNYLINTSPPFSQTNFSRIKCFAKLSSIHKESFIPIILDSQRSLENLYWRPRKHLSVSCNKSSGTWVLHKKICNIRCLNVCPLCLGYESYISLRHT